MKTTGTDMRFFDSPYNSESNFTPTFCGKELPFHFFFSTTELCDVFNKRAPSSNASDATVSDEGCKTQTSSFFSFFFLKLLNQIFICNSTECAKSFVFLAHVQITGGAVECAALAGWQRNRLLELWTMQHSIKVWYLYFKYTHTQRYTHTVNNQSLQTMCKDFFLKELSKGLPQSAGVWGAPLRV